LIWWFKLAVNQTCTVSTEKHKQHCRLWGKNLHSALEKLPWMTKLNEKQSKQCSNLNLRGFSKPHYALFGLTCTCSHSECVCFYTTTQQVHMQASVSAEAFCLINLYVHCVCVCVKEMTYEGNVLSKAVKRVRQEEPRTK